MDTSYYVITLIIVLSGYFWGKIANKYAPALKKVNTTVLGIFAIFGLFEVFTMIGIENELPAGMYRICILAVLCISPVMCLILRVNVLPHLNDLFAGLFSVAVTALICYSSSGLNTGNIFFDSVYYMSRVIDSSTADTMAHLSNFDGVTLQHIYSLYDYQGYYYFWGSVLRQYRMLYPTYESLTPMYVWCATMVYGITLGNLIAMSIQVLLPKLNWKNLFFAVLIIAFISPYYVNYFNTTLAFYGNTIKTVAVGAAMMIAYLYLKEKKGFYMILLALVYLAGLSFSSSCFFQFVFISAILLFAMLVSRHQKQSLYKGFFLANLPLIAYFYLLEADWSVQSHGKLAVAAVAAYAVILISSFFWNKIPKKAFSIMRLCILILYMILVIGMIVLSLPLANSEMGYAFYFESRSENDMTLNYTSWTSSQELIRNILLWVLLVISLIRFKKNIEIKWMIVAALIMFLNPLVCPFIAKYITNSVYCRSFEIIANPFVLIFLASEFLQETKLQWLAAVSMTALSCCSSYIAYYTVEDIGSDSSMLRKNQNGYNWETKVTDDQWDMYTYVYEHISSKSDVKYQFLTSDPAMKAYVPNIQMYYSTIDIRNTNNSQDFDPDDTQNRAIIYFNPLGVVPEDTYKGYAADYTQLADVIASTDSDYVIMRTPFAVWDEKGYYIEAYKYATQNLCEVVYENNTWILLKVKK